MPRIKILASYHDEHKAIHTDIVESIQTGCANAEKHFEGMLHDDIGDNISAFNDYYCELSAQYWAWKNYATLGNPDYIGFMHDRRHFQFNEDVELMEQEWLKKSGYHFYPLLTDEYIYKNFDSKLIEDEIEGNDAVLVKPFNFKNRYINGKNVNKRENYSFIIGQYVENYDLLMTITKNMYPEYAEDVDFFKKSNLMYLCNMYIMKRELFFEYADFLFSVLGKIHSLVDTTWFTHNGRRYLGYLGEFLCNIFILHKLRTTKIKVGELPMVVIKSRDDKAFIRPYFKENFCAVAIPCSDAYVPYLSVWLQSLIETSSRDHNYDIIVLENDISEKNMEKLTSMLVSHDNISLRFFNPSIYIDISKVKVEKKYLSSISTYRITVNKFMKGYSKVVIAEVDLIMKRDIKDLYDTNIGSAPIAAEIDPFYIMNYSRISWLSDFVCNTLGMSDKYRYVNTGVMILNIENFNEHGYTEKLLDFLYKTNCSCLEQDAMNGLFDNRIYLLDGRWNALHCDEKRERLINDMPKKLYDAWKLCVSDPWIMHWCGQRKPWQHPEEFKAYMWWELARKTPYYEEILSRLRETEIQNVAAGKDAQLCKDLTQLHFPSINRRFADVYTMSNYSWIYFHMIRCRLLKHLCSGSKKKHYKEKYAKLKNLYQYLHQIKKQHRGY